MSRGSEQDVHPSHASEEQRRVSSPGSILTWVFGLLLLASVHVPMVAASVHHTAAQTKSVDAADGALIAGLRSPVLVKSRSGDRGASADTSSGSCKALIAESTTSVCPVVGRPFHAADRDGVLRSRPASAFEARGPPSALM